MASQKFNVGIIIALIASGILLTITATGLLTGSQTVPVSGTISTVNVGVYTDAACSQNCTNLNLGTVLPGDSVEQIIYIKNTGTTTVTLSMTVNNWNPTNANSYLSLTWNRENTILAPEESIQATLTLTSTEEANNLSSFGCALTFTGIT